MARISLILLAAVGMVAFTPPLTAQTQTDVKPPVIQAETREVEVDVTVTAKKGISTAGLTADYFSVKEDGKVQKINSVQTKRPEASLKHLVIYLDFYTSNILADDQQALAKAIEGFIDSAAAPDRYMSVMSMTWLSGPRVLQDFTTASGQLIGTVADAFANYPSWASRAGLPRHSLGDSTAAVCRSMGHAPGDNVLLMVGNYNFFQSNAVDPPTAHAIQACNEANVRVYVVVVPLVRYSLGGWSRGGPPIAPGVSKADGPPRSGLAEQTGGLAFGVSPTLKDDLAAIVSEPDHYYRLFYTPPSSKDGVCHKLSVSMKNRDLSARARNGYCTEKQSDAFVSELGIPLTQPTTTCRFRVWRTIRADLRASRELRVPTIRVRIDLPRAPGIDPMSVRLPAGSVQTRLFEEMQMAWGCRSSGRKQESAFNQIPRLFQSSLRMVPDVAFWPEWIAPSDEGSRGVINVGFVPAPPVSILEQAEIARNTVAALRPTFVVFMMGTEGMTRQWAPRYVSVSVAACQRLNCGALFLGGADAGDVYNSLPAGFAWREFIPLDGILPTSSAIVHHGGIGTAVAAARHGTPQLIIPRVFAQPSNAEWFRRAGLCSVLQPEEYTTEKAVTAITNLMEDARHGVIAREIATRPGFLAEPSRICDFFERFAESRRRPRERGLRTSAATQRDVRRRPSAAD